MSSKKKPRARRMAPEARRAAIVDAAVTLIVETGNSGVSLEQVAEAAGISKPLIYKYFPRRDVLLEAILAREFKALGGSGLDSIPSDLPVEQVIRRTVARALRYYHDRGPILRLLATEPALTQPTRAGNRTSRSQTTRYFVKTLRAHYGVPEDVAQVAVTMVVNAPIHSMTYLKHQQIDIDRTIEVWSEFIVGGWQALEKRYGSKESEG